MQGTLERALTAITGESTGIAGSGRTDAGAHACAQVVAFSTHSSLPVETLKRALNAHLPHDIAVVRVDEVDESFHPRFDAVARVYRYLIWNRPERSPFLRGRAYHVPVRLDEAAMREALNHLVGILDVSAFVPVAAEGSRTRQLFAAACRRDGDLITITLEASGFMRQMVRAIVGTVLRVGRGTITLEEFDAIVQAGRRELAGDTAPAEGLYLEKVVYRDMRDEK